MGNSTNLCVVTTTVPTESVAMTLAGGLLAAKLVACAQIEGPIHSLYRWQGGVETAREYRLVLKTVPRCWQGIQDYIATHHPYDLPQLVQLDGVGNDAYVAWVGEAVE